MNSQVLGLRVASVVFVCVAGVRDSRHGPLRLMATEIAAWSDVSRLRSFCTFCFLRSG